MTENKPAEISNIVKNIEKARRVAIVLPAQVSVDGLSAAMALQAALMRKSDSLVSALVFSSSMSLPELPFLRRHPVVHSALNSGNQLVIKVSNHRAQPAELRYEKDGGGLTIYITPEKGNFSEQDVSVLPGSGNFDLVIILGASGFEQLGNIYTENAKLFFETTALNIDYNPSNEYYGSMNYVQTTASSLSEVVMDLIEAMPGALQNNRAATSLLAGIISQTGSFRDPKTTPQALMKASRLVAAGARQQDIIQHLFKTKPLSLLQLWGRALARLNASPEKSVVTAIVTASDLEKTQVPIESLHVVLKDIIEMVNSYSLAFLVAEVGNNKTQILAAGLPHEDLSQIAKSFNESVQNIKPALLTGKYEFVSFEVNDNLDSVQLKLNELINKRNSVL